MYRRMILKDLKRKKTMNIILLLFVVLSAMFTASGVNNIMAVERGLDHYFEDLNLESGYIVGGEKTEAGRNRIIPIPPKISEISGFIADWISKTETESLLNISVAQLRKNFYKVISDLGLENGEKLTPHSTRHTFASLSASAGMRAENLQKIIGHASYNTTAEVYIHQDFEKLKEEMSKLKK